MFNPADPRPARFGFSALQRAENSSIVKNAAVAVILLQRFSALQRAENSSILRVSRDARGDQPRFQCSSASRKFLNP